MEWTKGFFLTSGRNRRLRGGLGRALFLTGLLLAQGGVFAKSTKTKARDEVVLTDGKIIRGTLLDTLDDELVIEGENGKLFIEIGRVKRIERSTPPGFQEFFERGKKRAKDVKDWKKLGKFCEKKGAHPELRVCMRKVLAFDSEDEEARRVLGHLFFERRWLVEREVAERLQMGYRIVDGALVPPATKVVIPKAKERRSRRRDIRAVDHLEKVLGEREAHSLWMLLRRSGVLFTRMDALSGATDLKFCEKLIAQASSKKQEYRGVMKSFLDSLGVPKVWDKANQERIAKFKKKYQQGIYLESDFYHILSTDSLEVTRTLAQKMDLCTKKVYHKIFEFEEKIPHKYILIFFKDRQQFVKYGKTPGAAAYFSPRSKELVGYNLQKDLRVSMDPYQTLFHEGWHQYFDFYIPNCPRWFDEGLAEVVGGTVIERGRVKHSGFNPMRSRTIISMAQRGRLIPLRELVKMSHRDFMQKAHVAYAQSWSFTYFLTTYRHANKKIERRVRNFYKDYFWELHKGTDPSAAVDIVFKDVKFDTLEEAWIKKIPYQK